MPNRGYPFGGFNPFEQDYRETDWVRPAMDGIGRLLSQNNEPLEQSGPALRS